MSAENFRIEVNWGQVTNRFGLTACMATREGVSWQLSQGLEQITATNEAFGNVHGPRHSPIKCDKSVKTCVVYHALDAWYNVHRTDQTVDLHGRLTSRISVVISTSNLFRASEEFGVF